MGERHEKDGKVHALDLSIGEVGREYWPDCVWFKVEVTEMWSYWA